MKYFVLFLMTFSIYAGKTCNSSKGHVVKVEKDSVELNLPSGEVFKSDVENASAKNYIIAKVDNGNLKYFIVSTMSAGESYLRLVRNNGIEKVSITCKK